MGKISLEFPNSDFLMKSKQRFGISVFQIWSLSVCSEGIAQWEKLQYSCSVIANFATPWTVSCQASLSITNFWSLLKLMSIKLVMPSNQLILCRPLLLLPSIFWSLQSLQLGFFSQWVSSSHQVAKVLEFQRQSFHWMFRTENSL